MKGTLCGRPAASSDLDFDGSFVSELRSADARIPEALDRWTASVCIYLAAREGCVLETAREGCLLERENVCMGERGRETEGQREKMCVCVCVCVCAFVFVCVWVGVFVCEGVSEFLSECVSD